MLFLLEDDFGEVNGGLYFVWEGPVVSDFDNPC